MRKQKKAVNKKLSSGYSYKRPAVFFRQRWYDKLRQWIYS